MAVMKLGRNAKFYRNTANFASPTWAEVSAIRDLTVNSAWQTTDAPDRSTVVNGKAKTLLDLTVSGTLKCKDADAGYVAVMEAMLSPSGTMDVLVLDGPNSTNGARGYRFTAIVTQANQDQGLSNSLYQDVNFEPDAFADNAPQSAVVTNSAPVLTTL